jgi:hypothetical protein
MEGYVMKKLLIASAITLPLVFFIYWLFGFEFERGLPLGSASVIAVMIITVETVMWEVSYDA